MAITSTPTRRASFDDVEKHLDRHGGNGQPLIWSEDTDPEAVEKWRNSGSTPSKRKASLKPKTGTYYRRTTTYIDVLGDKSNLVSWKGRRTAMGLIESPRLFDEFAALNDPDGEDRSKANAVVERAQEFAGSKLRANAGTAVHSFLEDVDSGIDPGWIPEEYEADIASYIDVTKDLEVLAIELFCVQDEYRVAGTFDRLVAVHGDTAKKLHVPDGTVSVLDVKTGRSIDFDYGKIAMQIAGYSRMKLYDVKTFKRSDIHPQLNMDVGIVAHLPLGEGECKLYGADLGKGWNGFQMCRDVHEWRSYWNKVANKPKALN